MIRVCIHHHFHSICFEGVSEQLKKLLATLHEEDISSAKIGLSAGAREFVPGKMFPGQSLSNERPIQEFVPGKPFVLPSLERDRSSVAYSDAGSESMSSVSRGAGIGGLNTEAPEFVPSWQKSTTATATVAAAAAATAVAGDKKVWWYRDPQGVVRGPFSTTEMKAWSEKGYFSGGLEIALSDRGPYLPLSSVYPPPERPFWKSIEPREFATRMRQHILASRNVM
jgi:hypothetical protein